MIRTFDLGGECQTLFYQNVERNHNKYKIMTQNLPKEKENVASVTLLSITMTSLCYNSLISPLSDFYWSL